MRQLLVEFFDLKITQLDFLFLFLEFDPHYMIVLILSLDFSVLLQELGLIESVILLLQFLKFLRLFC